MLCMFLEWFYSIYSVFLRCIPGRSSVNYMSTETRSRLSKTVDQIVRDNVAVPYYIQFMESRGADHLVRFWLEAESFRSTSWSRVRAHSLNSVKHSSLAEPASTSSPPSSPPDMDLPSMPRPPSRPLTPSPQDNNSEGPTAQLIHRHSFSLEAGQRPGTPRAETPTRQPSSRTGTPFKLQSTNALRELSDKLMKSKWAEASLQKWCLFQRNAITFCNLFTSLSFQQSKSSSLFNGLDLLCHNLTTYYHCIRN